MSLLRRIPGRMLRWVRGCPGKAWRFAGSLRALTTTVVANLAFDAVAATMLFLAKHYGDERLYTFGSASTLSWVVHVELWLLALTHVVLAVIMLAQAPWTKSEASTFRFVSVKSMFWLAFAFSYQRTPGLDLYTAVLLFCLVVTTTDLNINLFRRYILGSEDADIAKKEESIADEELHGH